MSEEDIPDFSPTIKQPRFRIDGDVFTAVRDIPTMTALNFATQIEKMDLSEGDDVSPEDVQVMVDILRMMLTTESADRFIARMSDADNPIGLTSFMSVVPWLLEQYGMRPTQPSSDSQDGSPNQAPVAGTESTESSQLEVSTSSPSLSHVPST